MSTATAPKPAPSRLRTWESLLLGVKVAQIPTLLPGVLLALVVALVANVVAGWLGGAFLGLQGIDPAGKASPISGIAVAVVLGLLVANTVGVKRTFAPGLDFAVKKLLRLGIILVGIKLSVVDVLRVGAAGVPVVVLLVAFGLGGTLLLARWTGVGRKLGLLAAASTAICGITATLAVAPSVDADDREVAYTVANVTLFGLVAMLVYPYLAHFLFAEVPGAAGLFLGTAIHDTSQVMGAAMSYREVFDGERAAQVATVAKLTRNALLVAVVPTLAYLHARSARAGEGEGGRKKISVAKLFPLFVLGFLALSLVRTVGDLGLQGGGLAFGVFSPEAWGGLARFLGEKSSALFLGTALAGVGLGTNLAIFKGLGLKPFFVGFAAAVLVGLASLGLATVVGPLL